MKVFLDMDGLLANLFDRVAQEIHHKSYKNITSQEKEEAKRIWTDKKKAAIFFNKLGGVESFFAELPTFGENTNAIINAVVQITGEYRICSHPAAIDREASKRGKIKWIKKHLIPQPVEMLFPQNKADYAIDKDGTPNVLVDDFPPYIKAWKNAGGIAIQMRTDDFVDTSTVTTFLAKRLNEAQSKIAIKESFKDYTKRLNKQCLLSVDLLS